MTTLGRSNSTGEIECGSLLAIHTLISTLSQSKDEVWIDTGHVRFTQTWLAGVPANHGTPFKTHYGTRAVTNEW